jgi:hypothetical protein
MGKMMFEVDDKVELVFRETAYRIYGYKKGALSLAATDAMRDWKEKHKR